MPKKITVRFVVERDFEYEPKDPDFGLGSCFCIGDNMVMGGEDIHNFLVHPNIFDVPISPFRFVNDMHQHDANLYNLTSGSVYEIQPWLLEGETDDDA